MDYEKKYNEALERARQIKDGKDEWRYSDLAEITPALTDIFPELRESEDERIRKDIISLIYWLKSNRGLCSQYYKDRYDGMLSYLEKQKEQNPIMANSPQLKEQKPAWSEEDEEMRNLIVAIFEVNHPNGFFKANELGTTDMRGVHTEEIVSWLKSLRPSWKPSEEQMDALAKAVTLYGSGLDSLYQDLKKLI